MAQKQPTDKSQKSPPSASAKSAVPHHPDPDAPHALTAPLLASYNAGHHHLLAILTMIAAFVFACFPISDPDIFTSLRIGQMVSVGEFPFGKDPFGYAEGIDAPWVHPGWLGDWIIYQLYQLGGGPVLVFARAFLLVLAMGLLLHMGKPGPRRFLAVFTIALGLLALTPRLYLRTEFFSYVLLAATFWALTQPATGRWLQPLHRLTAGRWYWLLIPLFVLWANLDNWFFLGPITAALWFLATAKPAIDAAQKKSLGIVVALGFVASLCSPNHIKSYLEIPNLLLPATATELSNRYQEQKKQAEIQLAERRQVDPNARLPRMGEETRLFTSPWSGDYFNSGREDLVKNVASEAPFLPMAYPMGLSFGEWAYYLLALVTIASFLVPGMARSPGRLFLMAAFFILGAWQSRFTGFFAVGGTALAMLNWQDRPASRPVLHRGMIFFGQITRLATGLALQFLCLLMLIPSPDLTPASPAPLGYVHPRGTFGFSFRTDPSMWGVAEQLHIWQQSKDLPGNAFHLNWLDLPAYDNWFNPGGRAFFDRRSEAHGRLTVATFLEVQEALHNTARDFQKIETITPADIKARQQAWIKVFQQHDISHLVLRRRDFTVRIRGQVEQIDLIMALLNDRDESSQPLWKPLQYHDGQIFVLAWTGSKHWPAISKLLFDPGEEVFRRKRQLQRQVAQREDLMTFTNFVRGDPPRKPISIEESRWLYKLHQVQPDYRTMFALTQGEPYGLMVMRFAGQYAAPGVNLPIPFLLSDLQTSASRLFLSLDASRRAVAALSADSTLSQQADAWEQMTQALLDLSEYEQRFTPAAMPLRESLRLHALRKAAYACDAANRLQAYNLHMQMARVYRSRGAIDSGWEHVQLARTFVERNAEEYVLRLKGSVQSVSQLMDKLPELLQQELRISLNDFETDLKRRTEAWEQAVVQNGWANKQGDPAKFAVNRADLALRAGLANRALQELIAARVRTPEAMIVAANVCMQLGQYDVQLDEYLSNPEVQKIMNPMAFHERASLGWWCKGQPEMAALHRKTLADLVSQESMRAFSVMGMQTLFGTSTQTAGNVIGSVARSAEVAVVNTKVAEHYIIEGVMRLEAGDPHAAAERFLMVLRDIDPASPWKPLVARYYHQITGQTLDHDLQVKTEPKKVD